MTLAWICYLIWTGLAAVAAVYVLARKVDAE